MFTKLVRCCVAGLLLIAMSACEAYQVLTFSGHPNSGAQKTRLELEPISMVKGPSTDPRVQHDWDSYCQISAQPEFAGLAPFATLGATILIDQASQAIQDWTAKKKAQFVTSYTVLVTSDGFLVKVNGKLRPSMDCIIVKQFEDGGSDEPIFLFAGRVVENSAGNVFKMIPTAYRLSRATALTDSDSGKVDVDLKFVFNVVASGENVSQKVTGLGTAEVQLKALVLPPAGSTSVAPVTIASQGPDNKPLDTTRLGQRAATGWLPANISDTAVSKCENSSDCIGIEPLTLTMTMTETGTGSDAFGKLNKDVSDNTKGFEAAVTSTIQSALGSGSSASSSKGK